jgi:ribosome production factor 1
VKKVRSELYAPLQTLIVYQKRLLVNIPRTLDNTREFDPSLLTTDSSSCTNNDPSSSLSVPSQGNLAAEDIANDPFAAYFSSSEDPTLPPKVLITTSPKASKTTYEFCDELVGIFPGAEFIRRKKGKGFELGRIAGWAADREYKHMLVINEDMKRPSVFHVLDSPSCDMLIYSNRCRHPRSPSRRAYRIFQTLLYRAYSKNICKNIMGLPSFAHVHQGRARATPHHPELILNNFVTRLGHAVGRMFQTLFPPMPEFQGRQVVTLHNQRDFLFFRRHRCVSTTSRFPDQLLTCPVCQLCIPIHRKSCSSRDRPEIHAEVTMA